MKKYIRPMLCLFRMTFEMAVKENSGVYCCEAESRAGTATSNLTLLVDGEYIHCLL